MKKSILILAAFLFPAIVIAQTPSLYDEWSPMLFGTKAHFVISQNEIVLTFPQETETGPIAAFLTAPAMPSPESPKIDVKTDPAVSRTTKVKLLKVIYDSVQAKGRFFISIESKYDTNILPMRFLLKDNGEAEIGLAANPMSFLEGGKKSLKQIEKETSPSAKKTHKKRSNSSNFDFNCYNALSDFSFTFYNKARTAEFAMMKDPQAMPKEEMIGMMNSLGDRLAAELQKMPQDTSTGYFSEVKLMGPLFKIVPQMAHDLFIAHGYNPLGAATVVSKFEKDSDVMAAGKVFSDKIEESVPALRERKAKREAQKIESIKSQIEQVNTALKARADLISNFTEAIKGTEGLDPAVIDKLSAARSNAAALVLTEEITKDSAALEKFQKAQEDLSSAIAECNTMTRKIFSIRSNEKITSIISELEGKENRVRIEFREYNDLLNHKYTNPEKVRYYCFTGKDYQPLTAEELHPIDTMMTPAPQAPPPPPPAYAPAQVPMPLQPISIDYPAEAKSADIEGKVNFSALVGKDGNVIKVSINKSDNKIFNQAVIDAVKKIHFTPAKLDNGELTKVWYSQTINFKLSQNTAEPEK